MSEANARMEIPPPVCRPEGLPPAPLRRVCDPLALDFQTTAVSSTAASSARSSWTVADGRFAVHPVRSVDEAMAILTGDARTDERIAARWAAFAKSTRRRFR